MEGRYEYNCWLAHWVALHSALRELVTSTDDMGSLVEIRLSARVVEFDVETGVLRLEDGTSLALDLIVMAHGMHLHCLQEVVGREVSMIKTGISACCGLMRFESEVMRIPGLKEVFDIGMAEFDIPRILRKVCTVCRIDSYAKIDLTTTRQIVKLLSIVCFTGSMTSQVCFCHGDGGILDHFLRHAYSNISVCNQACTWTYLDSYSSHVRTTNNYLGRQSIQNDLHDA